MKFITITVVLALMIVATVAHPPGSFEHGHEHGHEHGYEHEHESEENNKQQRKESLEDVKEVPQNDDVEKPITEPSAEVQVEEERSLDDTKLPVTIYYEGLCPDSRKLLTDLGRNYYSFKKYINLTFVPFGRAESLDAEGNEFKCHHGEKECVANKIHSCGVKYLDSQDAKQQFVVCQMRTDADQTGKECLSEAGGDWSVVSKCVDGDESKKLQLEAEKETKKISVPRLESVPTIVFNNELNSDLNNKAFKNLKSVFCELLSAKNIKDCE